MVATTWHDHTQHLTIGNCWWESGVDLLILYDALLAGGELGATNFRSEWHFGNGQRAKHPITYCTQAWVAEGGNWKGDVRQMLTTDGRRWNPTLTRAHSANMERYSASDIPPWKYFSYISIHVHHFEKIDIWVEKGKNATPRVIFSYNKGIWQLLCTMYMIITILIKTDKWKCTQRHFLRLLLLCA